jgi:hypothetical protein
MLYGAPLAAMADVAADETITMSPRGRVRIDGRARRHTWCGPSAWVATTRCSSSGSVSATLLPRDAIAPLLTTMSMNPKSATTCSTIARTCSASSTLAWYAFASPPAATMAATVSSAAAASRR